MMKRSTDSLGLKYIILVCSMQMVSCRVVHQHGSSGRRIRHGLDHRVANQAFGDSNVLARLQSDILSNLGMTQVPTANNQFAVPDYARQLALEQAAASNDLEEGEHFMEKSGNLLLIAKKVHRTGFGETIQFVVNAADRGTRMSEVKLYYYINSANITMTAGSEDEKLVLRLSLLTDNTDGTVTSQPIQNLEIHRHLIGWHSQRIPSNLITDLLNEGTAPTASNVTINFHLTCLNCIYQAFPETMTRDNVPFLKVEGRRRRSRRNGLNQCNDGGCCPRELIVDFEAMGWDWVLFPKRYTANYCAGSCSNLPGDRSTVTSQNHIVNAMLRYMRSGRTSSCCIPSSEEFIDNFIYTDQTGNIRTSSKTIRTIHSCRCT